MAVAIDVGRELDDRGLDRQPVLGRGLDDRHVADARRGPSAACAGSAWPTASGSRPSSRSCLSRSLAATPKRCSSSITSRPRSRNTHVLREQPVGADAATSTFPAASRGEHVAHLARRAKARDHLDHDGERREAPAKGLPVLEGEHGGRRQHRHLLAVDDRRAWPRASPPRSCRSRRRRRSADPSATGAAMSASTSPIAAAWSGVSSYSKASSNSRCQGLSAVKAWPGWALRSA